MILVTGAAGKTGLATIRALAAKGQSVRAMIRREAQRAAVLSAGASSAVVGDLQSDADVTKACHGVRKVYHICPNVHPAEYDIGKRIIDAAAKAGVSHFVFHSVLHPQSKAMPHHWEKMRVEAYLFRAKVPFTIVQPVAYMQNILGQWNAITHNGVYSVPYSAHSRLGMVDLTDVAVAVAKILTEDGHIGATYELATDEALSQFEVAQILAAKLKRSVRVSVTPLDDWVQHAKAVGLEGYQIETLAKMFHYYERFGFGGNGRVLSMLLGRQPMTFENFVQSTIKNL